MSHFLPAWHGLCDICAFLNDSTCWMRSVSFILHCHILLCLHVKLNRLLHVGVWSYCSAAVGEFRTLCNINWVLLMDKLFTLSCCLLTLAPGCQEDLSRYQVKLPFIKMLHRQRHLEVDSSWSTSRHGKKKLVLRLSVISLASLCLQQVAGLVASNNSACPLLANQQNAGFTCRFEKLPENLEACPPSFSFSYSQ